MVHRTMIEIHGDMLALHDLLEECGGDVSDPEVAEAVQQFESEIAANFKEKSQGVARVIREFEYRECNLMDEVKRLQGRARSASNSADWLRSMLGRIMDALGLGAVKGDYATITRSPAGGKQRIEIDPEVLPKEFFRAEVDNTAVRAAIDAGEAVPGVRVLDRGMSLRIR